MLSKAPSLDRGPCYKTGGGHRAAFWQEFS